MKVFLSSLENGRAPKAKGGNSIASLIVKSGIHMKYNLMSYFYIRKKLDLAQFIRDNSEEILIDSGAHTFQKGKKVDWLEYTKEYADFIREFDRPNVIGYFEMDVDNAISYEQILQLRRILESASDKIIPVWHVERGIENFKRMCEQYAGKIIAISGIRGEIKEKQFMMFLKYAKKHNCKVHCLGMTRRKVLDKVPFDYVDSSSWVQNTLYGYIGRRKVCKEFSREHRDEVYLQSYRNGLDMQKHYYEKWRGECGD